MAQANVSSRMAGTGFTLVEAVVALAIAAVVAAVAYPSYTAQLRKSRRADAMVALMQVEQAQERWRGSHRTYAAELGVPPPLGLGLRDSSTDGYYTLSLSSTSAAGYAVTATAVPGRSQAADSVCATMAVTVRRGNVQRLPPGCWTR